MSEELAPKDGNVDEKPRPASTDAIRLLITRCIDYESRLDREVGRFKNVGRNQNVSAITWLRKALDALTDLEDDCRLNRISRHEHCPTGTSSSAKAA